MLLSKWFTLDGIIMNHTVSKEKLVRESWYSIVKKYYPLRSTQWTETGGSRESYAFRTSAVRLFILPSSMGDRNDCTEHERWQCGVKNV